MEFVVDNLSNCRITHMYNILALHLPSMGASMGKQNTHAHTQYRNGKQQGRSWASALSHD